MFKNYMIFFSEICKIMETIFKRSLEQTKIKGAQKKEYQEKLNFTNQQLENLTNMLKIKIRNVTDDVEDKVCLPINI
jgi:hypothetical protein